MLGPLIRERILSALRGTPDVLDELLKPYGPSDPQWDLRPDPERFTLREVIAHLVDYEAVWQERITRTRDEVQPSLVQVDREQLVIDHDYAHSDPLNNLTVFRQHRTELVNVLSGLAEGDWTRVARLPSPFGPLTLEEQAAFVAIHDGYHAGQVAQWVAFGR